MFTGIWVWGRPRPHHKTAQDYDWGIMETNIIDVHSTPPPRQAEPHEVLGGKKDGSHPF